MILDLSLVGPYGEDCLARGGFTQAQILLADLLARCVLSFQRYHDRLPCRALLSPRWYGVLTGMPHIQRDDQDVISFLGLQIAVSEKLSDGKDGLGDHFEVL